ncbi:MAG: thioredoxin domain-containing protein [Myxococcales bacterium]|nr:thioredoxin domain-containing protein [Myxococcales bacterium]
MSNRLADETSAYLRQHRDNPVDWYPWSPEPWERARREQRPVLVSIGYASCHWCHVMEHESFADLETAALMNQELVSIKVDREERPDVDQIYMESVVRLTGSGGWPLNVFCTPDGRPFFGGTYFPPDRAHGRPSWRELVTRIARVFREDPERVEANASQILEALTARPGPESGATAGAQDLHQLCVALLRSADREHGGFGDAPKFPTPTNLDALLLAQELGVAPAGTLDQVLLTLRRMARGGIFDQLGGGFHRYSTDARWAVPHFEKMLYDQGQLLRCYAETYRQTRDPGLEWPVAETIAWLERESLGDDGGPFASLDADSEGREGSFYVWSPDEIVAVLGEQRGREFCLAYGVTPGGNFEGTGKSVLAHGLAGDRPRFASARAELLEARGRRVRPATDRKRITAWTGYAIGGLATAGAVFERRDWIGLAERSADFVLEKLAAPGSGLLRIYDGSAGRVPGFLDDHAGMLAGLLDLYRASGKEHYAQAAIRIAEAILERFYTTETGELFFAPADSQDLPLRPRSDPDGATPASSGLALLGLVRLASLTGRSDFASVAAAGLAREGPEATRQPVRFPTLLRAAALHETSPSLCLILGDPESEPAQALAQRARARLGPDAAVVATGRDTAPGWLDPAWLEAREPLEGRPTAWLCRGQSCSLPATDPGRLFELPTA